MAVDHRLLHRMQRTVRLTQVLDRQQRLAVQRRQELDACVDGLELDRAGVGQLADDDRARAAVAFRAAFLGAGAMRVLAQVLQHGAGNVGAADFADRVTMVEADRLTHVSMVLQMGQGGPRCALDRRFSDSLHAITIKFRNP